MDAVATELEVSFAEARTSLGHYQAIAEAKSGKLTKAEVQVALTE